jgi:hypothetical protein
MKRGFALLVILALSLLALAFIPVLAAADADSKLPSVPLASSFAPADDLLDQFDFYTKRIEEGLASKSDFDDAAKSRLKKDANTLAALSLTLGMHDSDHRFKASAGELLKAAQSLATAANYEAAEAGLVALKKAIASNSAGKEHLKWEQVASLEELMKQVPTVNAALKRGLTPQRFKTLQKQSAGQAATLAAIAQTVMADTKAVKNAADHDKWYQYCAEMRDAAGAVNTAIHADDQSATTAAMSRLAKSCETCHAVFRKEPN